MAEYHVENFGCRASRFDGEAIAANLRHSGLAAAEAPDSAQIVIVNTCSVTAEADRQARAYLRRVRRQNPNARIVVTGCYAQRAPEELAALPEVDAVVGNSHKSRVAEVALDLTASPGPRGSFVPLSALAAKVLHDDAFAHFELAALPFAPDAHQTRPNLKVQDGCRNRCSFCIIPTTRGPSRSVPLAACLDNVRRFADQDGIENARGGGVESAHRGGLELVLSGINLGRWGRDLTPPQRFEDLVAAILSETSLPRLRLSSIEPMDWSPDLLALYREYATEPGGLHTERSTLSADLSAVRYPLSAAFHPRLARHTHLPLQSGSDTILRRMHRRYRPWHYAERLAAIRALLPDAAIGADVMIGFPGETDALFEESYDFIAAQPFTYLHLFPFSARPGTPAWELHRQQPVPPRAVQERMAALRALIADKFRAFRQRFVGRTLSAVTMDAAPDGATDAMSDNFLRLSLTHAGTHASTHTRTQANGAPVPGNQLVAASITALTADGLAGTVAAPAPIQ